jgi:hypothetical protein
MVSYIWRDKTNPPDSSNNSSFKATDYISFELSVGTDDNAHIHQSEFKFLTALADNEKPNAKLNELQDTQLDSITITITGSIENQQADGGANAVIQKAKQWMCDKKTKIVASPSSTTPTLPKGRFGLKLSDFSSFNVYPKATLGFMIQDWTWVRDGDTPGKTSFIATLRLNGDIGAENSTYAWNTEVTS